MHTAMSPQSRSFNDYSNDCVVVSRFSQRAILNNWKSDIVYGLKSQCFSSMELKVFMNIYFLNGRSDST